MVDFPRHLLDQWEHMDAGYQDCCRRDATAAIRAVHEHLRMMTKAMRAKGWAEVTVSIEYGKDDALDYIYLAMLEAATKGEPK